MIRTLTRSITKLSLPVLLTLIFSAESLGQAFITTWQTTTDGEVIEIPGDAMLLYNYTVDWGDGTVENIVTTSATHTYALAGTYSVEISGTFPRIILDGAASAANLQTIEQWGSIDWASMNGAFADAVNLVINATDVPNLTVVSNFSRMFADASSLVDNGGMMGSWDMSNAVFVNSMFIGASLFNEDIGNWTTTNFQNTAQMFQNAISFNQDISAWDMGNVTDITSMFSGASSFNQPIGAWNTMSVTQLNNLFINATSFNQDISSWTVTGANNMSTMFFNATSFNQDLSAWDFSNVANMSNMFDGAIAFDQNMGSWDISSVNNMSGMLDQSGLSTGNYDLTLVGWAALPMLQTGVVLGADGLTFSNSTDSRDLLINTFGWTVLGDVLETAVPFVSTWRTSVANETIVIPTVSGEIYNYSVDWGDGTPVENFTDASSPAHTYAVSGDYNISITGIFPRIFFAGIAANRLNIIDITQWGNIAWTSMEQAFEGCENLNVSATDAPDFSAVNSLERMFANASSLNADFSSWDVTNVINMEGMFSQASSFDGDVTTWDVGNVQNMSGMFSDATVFNQAINNWDVSSVTNMSSMFAATELFNQDISSWDVGNVINMNAMFINNLAFDQPIGGWDVTSVTSMIEMFSAALAFNQDISTWNVGNVTNMSGMFSFSSAFNQDLNSWDVTSVMNMSAMFQGAAVFNGMIGNWDVSTVTNMSDMFQQAGAFNQDISGWNVGNVTDMAGMFDRASSFNVPIGSWDVSSVVIMQAMFSQATSFNQNLNSWIVSSVTNTSSMFAGATVFNGDISSWDVGNVLTMASMFDDASAFDQDISAWDVSSVVNTSRMFSDAVTFNQDLSFWSVSNVVNMSQMFVRGTNFNQNLGMWDVSSVTDMNAIFSISGMSTDNYDQTLIGWAQLPSLQTGVIFRAENISHCASQAARNLLISSFGWDIEDNGLDCSMASMAPTNFGVEFSEFSDNIITFPNGPGFTDDITIEAWINFATFSSSDKAIASWEFPDGSYVLFGLTNSQLTMKLSFFDGTNFITNEVTDPDPCTSPQSSGFLHLAVSGNVNTGYRLYVDGELRIDGTITNPGVGTGGIFSIGARNNTDPAVSVLIVDQFPGIIDEVRIYDIQRTEVEINNDIYRTFSVGDNQFVAGYNFNEGAGTILSDINLVSQNGVLTNFTGDPWVPSTATEFPAPNEMDTLNIANNPATSGGLTLTGGSGFPVESNDFIVFGHNGGSPENFVTDAFIDSELIRSRSEREYFAHTLNEGTGGEVDFTFTSRNSDPGLTYYLLSRSMSEIAVYEPVSYSSVSVSGNTYTFTVPVDSLPNRFFALGRGPGAPGNALNFNASDAIIDHVTVNNPPSITADMTVEAWINVPLSNFGTILGFGGYTVEGRYFRLGTDGSDQVFAETSVDNIDPAQRRASSLTITPGVWTHIALTKTGNDIEFYIDGMQAGSFILPIDAAATTMVIGATDDSSTDPIIDGFLGDIDELRIWDVVRTQQEIQDNQFQTLTGNEANLQAYYRFDQPSGPGSFLPDYSGNNQPGVLTNFEFIGETSDWVASGALSSTQNALSFDGMDDRVVTTQGIGLADDHAVELWVQNNASGVQRQSLFLIGSVTAGSVSAQGYLENNLFHVELRQNNGVENRIVQALDTDFSDLAWHHIAYTFNISTTEIKIYIDGVEQNTSILLDQGDLSDFHLNTVMTLGVGDFLNPNFADPFLGSIDEVRVWNSLLTAETIRDYLNSDDLNTPLHPNLPFLVLQYSFNEGSPGGNNTAITQIVDGSTTANSGDLLGFLLTDFSSNFIVSQAFEQSGRFAVLGNGISIMESNTSNLLADNTNMGLVRLGDGSLVAEFQIVNTGTGPLNNILASPITSGLQTFGQFSTQLDVENLDPFDTALLTVTYVPEQVGASRIFLQIEDDNFSQFLYSVSATAFEDEAGPGTAAAFDGMNNNFNLGQVYDFEADSAFSIEAWINYEDPGMTGFTLPIISNRIFNTEGTGYDLSIQDGLLVFGMSDDGFNNISATSNDFINPGEWTHVVVTYDGSLQASGINLYINAVLAPSNNLGSLMATNSTVNTEDTYMGFDVRSSLYFLGRIDEIRIWDGVLSDFDIGDRFQSTVDPATAGLIGYYRADINSGLQLVNQVGDFGVAEFALAPGQIFDFSNAPLNNDPVFTALGGRAAVWSPLRTANSSNLILFGDAFLVDEGDRAFIAGDAGSNDFVDSQVTNLSPQVVENLQRNWLMTIVDSTTMQVGGDLFLSFIDQLPDSSRTYYLLKGTGIGAEFALADYNGYVLASDSITFNVSAEDLDPTAVYSLGRSETLPGNALSFDGVNDYVTVDEVGHTEFFTYELWVKPQQLGVEQTIFDFNNTAGGGVELVMTNSATFGVTATNPMGVDNTILSFSQGTIGEWVHLAVTGDGVNLNLYVNGILESSGSFANGTDFSGPMMLGASTGGVNNFEGAMDEFRLWGSARTALEIQENLANIVPQNTTGMIAGVLVNYRFDQVGGSTTLPDLSGTGFYTEGQLNNFNFNAVSGWFPSNAFEPIVNQNALSFDGVNDFVNVPTLPFPDNYTVEAWINPSELGVDEFDLNTIFSWGFDEPGMSNDGLVRLIMVQGEISYIQQTTNATFSSSNPTGAFLNLNEWHHVAVVNEQNMADALNTVRIYVDGRQVAELPSELRIVGPPNFNIGAITFEGAISDHFPGLIEEVRVWDTALTIEQIRENIARELPDPGAAANLIAYYQFNQGAPDGNNGVLTNLTDTQDNHDGDLSGFALSGMQSNFTASTLFDSFNPEIAVSLGDGTETTNGTAFDFETRLIGEVLPIELVIQNTGLDTLNVSSLTFTAGLVQVRNLVDSELLPFESDTIEATFEVTEEFFRVQDIFIESDAVPDNSYRVSFTASGYPDLPGAGNRYLVDNSGTQFANSSGLIPTELNSQSFSIEYWAQRNDNTTPDFVFGQGGGMSIMNEDLHVGFRAGDVVTFSFFNNDLDFNWTEANNDWNHFAFTFNYDEVAGTGTRRIYINGIEVAADPAPVQPFIGSGEFFVGQAAFGDGFFGQIDELRIWNSVLDEATIRQNLAQKLPNNALPLADLVAYYRFDDSPGSAIQDLASNYELVNNGGNQFRSSAPFGDVSLFTYSASRISTEAVGQPVVVNNIAAPAQGVHLYQVEDADALPTNNFPLIEISTDLVFGVFAPGGNTFDFNAGLADLPEDPLIRLVRRDNQADFGWEGASDLFGTDLAVDSVRSFDQMTGEFSLGRLDYDLVTDAGTALTLTSPGVIEFSSDLNNTYGDFTIEYWVQPTANLAQVIYFEQAFGFSTQPQIIQTGVLNGHLYIFARETADGASGLAEGNIEINDNEWHHVAYVRSGTSLSLYVDGVLDVMVSDALPFSTSIAFESPSVSARFRGDGQTMDEARFWNASLSQEELRNFAFTNDLTDHPRRDDLFAYHRFDDAVQTPGFSLVDLIGSAHGQFVDGNPSTDWVPSGAFETPPNMVVSLADSGPGSLRNVIEMANQTPEIDTIRFDLPGEGPWVIETASTLTATDSLVIDATSQPGWDIVTGAVVEIQGSGTTPVGLEVTADYIELYGLRVNNYLDIGLLLNNSAMSGYQIGEMGRGNIFINNGGSGIQINGPDDGLIQSNFVGSDFDGTGGLNDVGIFITADATINGIGGVASSANVIAFNNVGVQVNGVDAFGNEIRQNEIFCNVNRGIILLDGGNNGIVAPTITQVTTNSVSGTGLDGQEIDVYLATDPCNNDQGNSYIGTAIVSGNSWLLDGLTLDPGGFYTATANTSADGTSEFSGNSVAFSADDIAALERIFNDLDGANWTPAVNWQNPGLNISQWDGIMTNEGRVTQIILPNQNLTGDFPTFTGDELALLEGLDVAGNNITSLPDLTTLTLLNSLSVQNNFLDFASLEPNVGIGMIPLGPQNLLLEEDTPLANEGDDITLDRVIGGSNNVYSWTRDGMAVAGGTDGLLVLTAVSFGDEGDYVATVTNANVPGVTLTTTASILRVSSLERDQLALEAIFAALDGPNWNEASRTGWLQGTVSESWTGVDLDDSNSRVIGLDISGAGASGELPVDILEMLSMATINIANNDVDSIPAMGSLANLTSLDVSDNLLQFDDLEANLDVTGFVFTGQRLGDAPSITEVAAGEDFTVSVSVGGSDNAYQWSLDGQAIPGATDPDYLISPVNLANSGIYTCLIESNIPALSAQTFTSAADSVFGLADVSGFARIAGQEGQFLSSGIVRLLAVREDAYDTIRAGSPFALSAGGAYLYEDIRLDEYIVLVDPTDRDNFLPTYFEQVIQWDAADTLRLDSDTTGIDVFVEPVPTVSDVGDGGLTGEVFTDFPEDGRLEVRRRVRRVGCALRRRRGQGRPEGRRPNGRVEMDDDGFELFSYQTTDDNGQFTFDNLPEGTYRLFIEYPGIPLDPDSFTEFEITSAQSDNDFAVEVTVFEDGILIEEVDIVGVDDELQEVLSIYPNPTSGELFVSVGNLIDRTVKIELLDLRGTRIFSQVIEGTETIDGLTRLSLDGMAPGVYLLQVKLPKQQDELLRTGKLIIKD